MAFCPNCGANNSDQDSFCTNCGAPLRGPAPSSNPGQAAQPGNQQAYIPQVSPDFQVSPPAPYPTGGLVAWSIITLLLCTIPGIVALVKTLGINKCATEEEQKKKASSAKTWCLVGTILGVLALIGSFAGMVI